MYIPKHFAVDPEQADAMLVGLRAADLVTATERGLSATFLPLLFDPARGPRGALLGHVARNNDVWSTPWVGEVLVIANGPNAYISPSWYASKAEHGRVVPTWDYLAVHVHGELRAHDDVAWVGDLVRRLTDRHEAGRAQPWSVDDAPAEYVSGQLRAIVGIEVIVSRVEVKAKMSQNRPAADIDGVVAGLTADGLQDIATEVERRRP